MARRPERPDLEWIMADACDASTCFLKSYGCSDMREVAAYALALEAELAGANSRAEKAEALVKQMAGTTLGMVILTGREGHKADCKKDMETCLPTVSCHGYHPCTCGYDEEQVRARLAKLGGGA